jgi:acyl carrier protein
MSEERARHIVLQAIHLVAPEVDTGRLDPAAPLRDQADVDEFDLGELAALLADALHADIPAADLHHLATVDGAVAYLAPRLPEPR